MTTYRLSRPARLGLVAAIAALSAGVIAAIGMPDLDLLRENQAQLIAWRDASLVGLTLGLILANVAVVALCLPGSGFLFGFVPGTVLAVASGAVGACLVFLWVRAGFGSALRDGMARGARDSVTARLLAALDRNQFRALILLRIVPVVPFMVANVAPALLGIGMRRFFVTTLIGIAPGTALTAWIGAGAATALERSGQVDFGLALGPEIVSALVLLGVMCLSPLLIRFRPAEPEAEPTLLPAAPAEAQPPLR
jgi:uncharacterized membrane protein YdjX (TVP38/TMEM64 family)